MSRPSEGTSSEAEVFDIRGSNYSDSSYRSSNSSFDEDTTSSSARSSNSSKHGKPLPSPTAAPPSAFSAGDGAAASVPPTRQPSQSFSNDDESGGGGVDDENGDVDDSRLSYNDSAKYPHVYFKDVLIRNYDSTMSDNPSVSCGPPVGLDWKYAVIPPVSVEDFEAERDGFGPNGNAGKRVTVEDYAKVGRIYPEDRLRTCLNGGFTIEEIEDTVKAVRKIQEM